MTPRLPTLAIVRCCWVMWATAALYALNLSAAAIHMSEREWWQAAAYIAFSSILSIVLVNETRAAFGRLCNAIRSAAADYVAANTQA